MEFLMIVLLLLAIIGLSNFINHFMPYIPVPLIQIALGVLLAALPLGIHVPMEPELFFILFIAPLLFYDGKNVSRQDLWKLRKPILLLALGLVFLTVIVIGYLIHWLNSFDSTFCSFCTRCDFIPYRCCGSWSYFKSSEDAKDDYACA